MAEVPDVKAIRGKRAAANYPKNISSVINLFIYGNPQI